jgi:hypothetical protein
MTTGPLQWIGMSILFRLNCGFGGRYPFKYEPTDKRHLAYSHTFNLRCKKKYNASLKGRSAQTMVLENKSFYISSK